MSTEKLKMSNRTNALIVDKVTEFLTTLKPSGITHVRHILLLFLISIQSSFSQSFPGRHIPLPNEFENKRSSIPEYYQHLLAANKQAFESRTAAQDTGFTLVGHWAWGPCNAVDVKGNYAYVASGPTMLILDISNPASPQVVTEYLTQPDARGNVNDIKIRDTLLYLLDGFSFQILKIKNPTKPELISILYSAVTDRMALNDSLAFILHMNSGALKIVNIKDPYHPYFMKGWGGVGFGETSISISGNVIYVGSFESDGLYIFDCTNPDSISLSFYDTIGWLLETCVSDTLLLAGVETRPNNYLKIYSIRDPLHPQFLGKLYFGTTLNGFIIDGIAVRGTTAYVSTGDKGLYAVDISDPANPTIQDHLLKRSEFHNGTFNNIVVTNKYLYGSSGTGMWFVSTFPGDSMRSISYFPSGDQLFDIAIRDSLAYVADYNGIGVLNISNPRRPYRIAQVESPSESVQLKLDNNYIFISCSYTGVAIFDITNPLLPQFITVVPGFLPWGSVCTDLLIHKNTLFILDVDSLVIYDISNISNPKRISDYSLPSLGGSSNVRLAVKDSILYVAKEDSGIILFNVINPQQPKYILTNKTSAASLQIKDTLMYVLGNGFMSVFDISTPPSLILKTKIMTDGYYSTPIVFDKNFLYYKFGSEIHSVEIMNSFIYSNRGVSKLTDGGLYGLDIFQSYLFATDIVKGVRVLSNKYITKINEKAVQFSEIFQLYQNYPNPFNPISTIKYSLLRKENIRLSVYNILGQKIKELINEQQEAGAYAINFDVSSLPSGVYFYSLHAGKNIETKKMVVIR